MADQKRHNKKQQDELLVGLGSPEAKQAMVIWMNSHGEDISRASSQFYMLYGQAMDGWSTLEGSLALWFSKLTRMPPKRARRIFYSARSFSGRADMLKAAISATRIPTELKAFLITAIKAAIKYSSFRNQLVHGEANVHMSYEDENPVFEMLITEPKYMERMTPEFGVSAADVQMGNHAFRALAADLMMAFTGAIAGSQLEEYRERILQRPNLPNPQTSAQNLAKQK